jgi:anthranilate phosphoribosyltransferase
MHAWTDALTHGRELSADEVSAAAACLLDPDAPDDLKESLLASLARKGETPAEIAGFVEVFLRHAVDPQLETLPLLGPTLDVCGTGGDRLDLFNISTTSMFVAAAAGAVVVKHGNRGITSKSGGADVLEALGIRIDLDPAGFRRCIESAGVGFLFAPLYHPAFKAVVAVRKSLAAKGVSTLFNLIGPLLNPARPEFQLLGVFRQNLCPSFATILRRLGRRGAWVVHGTTCDGGSVDEVSLMGPSRICQSRGGGVSEELIIQPQDFGFEVAEVDALRGGDAATNAAILEAILSGKETGPRRDIVLLNAAAAIACCGLADEMNHGIAMAREAIASGAAAERLRRLREASLRRS